MIRIGIVGDIGSGKSYIAKKFGYPIFNADVEVAKIYKRNRNCYKKLKKKLPKYIVSFPIKKNEVSRAIMANKNNIKKIIKIVHPEVRNVMKKFLKVSEYVVGVAESKNFPSMYPNLLNLNSKLIDIKKQ